MNIFLILVRLLARFHYWAFHSSQKPPVGTSGVSSILINLSAGIGDALMAEPLVETLHRHRPPIRMDILVSAATKMIYENDERIHQIHLLRSTPGNMAGLVRTLRKQKYDAYIGAIPSNTLSQILVPYFSKIPYRIKHRTPHQSFRNYDFLFQDIEPIPEGRHRIECNLDLLKYLGIKTRGEKTGPKITVTEISRHRADAVLAEMNFDSGKMTVGFHPGCSPGAPGKRWNPENYAALGNYLHEQWQAQIVLVGGKDDLDDIRKIMERMKTEPLNTAGRCTLMETAAIISRCRFFVSNDSGIMHLATAVDVPTFAIFGPKDERHVGPYGDKHTVIRNGWNVNEVTPSMVIDILEKSERGFKRHS